MKFQGGCFGRDPRSDKENMGVTDLILSRCIDLKFSYNKFKIKNKGIIIFSMLFFWRNENAWAAKFLQRILYLHRRNAMMNVPDGLKHQNSAIFSHTQEMASERFHMLHMDHINLNVTINQKSYCSSSKTVLAHWVANGAKVALN